MGFNIFYRNIPHNSDPKAKALWDMVQGDYEGQIRHRVYDWCKEILYLYNVPDGAFKDLYLEELRQSNELDAIIEYIKENCEPEEPESDAETEDPQDPEED